MHADRLDIQRQQLIIVTCSCIWYGNIFNLKTIKENKMSDPNKDYHQQTLDGTFWDTEEGRECNLQQAHECLIKYEDKLTKGRQKLKIFVPLCGKAYDMIWLADKGHQVVGVEFSPVVIKQFFQLNQLDFTESDVASMNGKLYETRNGNIKIYNGDFFLFNKDLENHFDAVWDGAALHSLKRNQWKEYVDIMRSVMSPGCQYLLEDIVPSCGDALVKSEVEKYFGPNFTTIELGFTKTEVKFYTDWGTEGFNMFHIY